VIDAPAKINLALVVGPLGPEGKHEVTTVLQRVGLSDRIELTRAPDLRVEGFTGDTLVRRALELLADAARVQPGWSVRIEKNIPVAGGLGGGSADAAAALRLANATLPEPLGRDVLHSLAASLGADVPFFLTEGPQLGEGDGTRLSPLRLRQDYTILLALPEGESKRSTAAVYAAFDDRAGSDGYEARRARLLEAAGSGDLAALPRNDLADSALADELRQLGAFRADVSGAGPAVYALFGEPAGARAAEAKLASRGRIWIVAPAW
jgi:4-diphosphocytidyl-2-C-methyl-D-erythritol kinase